MAQRSIKYYRENEKEVMEQLGFVPTVNSGAGWQQKEDGESDCALCQLKSTDKASISIKQKDLFQLEYNAEVAHKIPVFAVQFLATGDLWLMVKPEALKNVLENSSLPGEGFINDFMSAHEKVQKNVDMANYKAYNKDVEAREEYHKRRMEEREAERKAWKKRLRKKG